MAKLTYQNKVPLNENPEIPDINKCKASDLNDIKRVVNENENKVLVAVSSSAPAECSTGDQYYNTTDNLIYTATATDTWGQTGEEPTLNTIYMVYGTQAIYSYDGNTLVSVGGGKPPIAIQSTQPTDAILWINPDEPMQSLGTEVVNSISGNQENRAPSVKAVKDNFQLKGYELYNNATGEFGCTLNDSSANYDYLEIYYKKAGYYGFTRIYQPNGKSFGANLIFFESANYFQVCVQNFSISGTSITKGKGIWWNYYYDGTEQHATETIDQIQIVRVVGYK